VRRRLRDLRSPLPPVDGVSERETNVAFANDLLDTEISQRKRARTPRRTPPVA